MKYICKIQFSNTLYYNKLQTVASVGSISKNRLTTKTKKIKFDFSNQAVIRSIDIFSYIREEQTKIYVYRHIYDFLSDCATANFTIQSFRYSYVCHYGIYDKLDLLEFSSTQTPAHFCFTSNNALQEVVTGKCVNSVTNSNLQLVLTNDCSGLFFHQWVYNPNSKQLININTGYCFSAWYYLLPPPEVQFVPGLSPCAEWNRVMLSPSKYLVYFFQFF